MLILYVFYYTIEQLFGFLSWQKTYDYFNDQQS